MTFSFHLFIQFLILVAAAANTAELIPHPYDKWVTVVLVASSQVFGVRAHTIDMEGRSLSKQEEKRTEAAERVVEKLAEKPVVIAPVPPVQPPQEPPKP